MDMKTVFSLSEDALLMSIVKRWTNVVYEDNSDVVTRTEKDKAWKKIEQTFNNLTVDENKGYRCAEVLKVRSEHLERLKNRRELMQNLASGEGNSISQQGSDAVMKFLLPLENSKSKHECKDDGDGNTSTDDAAPHTDTPNENEMRQDLLQLFSLREKLLRKEIKLRIQHSKLIFEKEMEILEIKCKNLQPLPIRSEPRAKVKRKTINRGDDYRRKPCWGQSIASVREDASKKLQSKRGKRRRKKVSSKTENVRGAGKEKRAGTWSRLDEGTSDNEDLASLTEDDGMVKLMLEHLKIRKDNETGRAENFADDTETEGTDSKLDFTENTARTNRESKIEEIMQIGQENGSVSDASLPTKLANILDKILKQDSTDELGKRNKIQKE